jgi:hypothetical protein
MLSHGDSRIQPRVSPQEPRSDGDHAIAPETGQRLLRFMLWLLRADSEDPAALPIRVFYKFDSGAWRSRNTRQLQKGYRCR